MDYGRLVGGVVIVGNGDDRLSDATRRNAMLIRVLEIPKPTGTFHFGKAEPQIFAEVDWFRDDEYDMMATPEGRAEIEKFIRAKRYFDPARAYLVLHQINTFTIGYLAP